jgi:hypothetical protein
MAFEDLTLTEKRTVLQCMQAISDGPHIDDSEFHTRLGIDRPTLKRIILKWPNIDDCEDSSDEFLAINNCLNEVCHGLRISATEWPKWFEQSVEEIRRTYKKWWNLRGASSGGVR